MKNSFKSLGGNYTEETIDKKSKATTLVNNLLEQDSQSLLIDSNLPGHSWERFEVEEIKRFSEYVHKIKPFRFVQNCSLFMHFIEFILRPSERSPVTYQDKSIPKSLYSCLDNDLIKKFFDMKIKNML